MSLTLKLKDRFYKGQEHPYLIYEKKIRESVDTSSVILDAGCGRTAPVLRKFSGQERKLIGVDLENCCADSEVEYLQCDISKIPLPDNCVDIVISRAVLEHVKTPELVFSEINRILKTGGSFIFLVPNLLDYASLASKIIPNKYHKSIVSATEGRDIADVFPAYYKANTRRAIEMLCRDAGFNLISIEYLSQYPSYFMFNPILFSIATLYEKTISNMNILKPLSGWILGRATKGVRN